VLAVGSGGGCIVFAGGSGGGSTQCWLEGVVQCLLAGRSEIKDVYVRRQGGEVVVGGKGSFTLNNEEGGLAGSITSPPLSQPSANGF
jgi:hypothetical protein